VRTTERSLASAVLPPRDRARDADGREVQGGLRRGQAEGAGPRAHRGAGCAEREREELVAGFVPAMEARGYYTGAVKAVLGS